MLSGQMDKQAHGSLVKWLRRCPLTAESGVRLPYGLFFYAIKWLLLNVTATFDCRQNYNEQASKICHHHYEYSASTIYK